MKIFNKTIEFKTTKYLEFVDITEEVKKFIIDNQIVNGQVLIYSPHTTLAIRVNEKEKGFTEDFKDFMTKLIPPKKYYRHNDLKIRTENLQCDLVGDTDCLNGHSHCTHFLMGASENIPIIEGKLMLGIWQWVFAIELDSARKRRVIMQIMGE